MNRNSVVIQFIALQDMIKRGKQIDSLDVELVGSQKLAMQVDHENRLKAMLTAILTEENIDCVVDAMTDHKSKVAA